MNHEDLDRFGEELQVRWEIEEAERKRFAQAAGRLHPVWSWAVIGMLAAAAIVYFLKLKGLL